jgi:hypothetical protein
LRVQIQFSDYLSLTVDESNLVAISPCDPNSPSQQWKYTGTNQIILFQNSSSFFFNLFASILSIPVDCPILDFCLDLPNSDVTNGNQVQTYPCNGGNNQVWVIPP